MHVFTNYYNSKSTCTRHTSSFLPHAKPDGPPTLSLGNQPIKYSISSPAPTILHVQSTSDFTRLFPLSLTREFPFSMNCFCISFRANAHADLHQSSVCFQTTCSHYKACFDPHPCSCKEPDQPRFYQSSLAVLHASSSWDSSTSAMVYQPMLFQLPATLKTSFYVAIYSHMREGERVGKKRGRKKRVFLWYFA